MDAFETFAKRRSVRDYTGQSVPREALLAIVGAGHMAATGYNKQPWDFMVIRDRTIIEEMARRTSEWLAQAGAIIVVVLDASERFWMEDGSAAIENMHLAATALGYGSCWFEGTVLPHEDYFKQRLGIPAERRILTFLPIGVVAEWPEGPQKKPLEQVLHWEKW
jgi:nitroreductase